MTSLALRAQAELELRHRRRRHTSQRTHNLGRLEDSYEQWLQHFYPSAFFHTLADRHHEFWRWVWRISAGEPLEPFIGVWPRGGGKSTNAEISIAALGARAARRYVLYVSETQQQADDHVQTIAARLTTPVLEAYYPDVAQRSVGKYGTSRGWRRNRLITRSGFVVDAMGLDSARRGAKIDDDRPDMIVLDDIDGLHDSLSVTERKVRTITESILPTKAGHAAILGVQNLVIDTGVFARLAGVQAEGIPRADFLTDRTVSGPHPAVRNLAYAEQDDGTYRITGGVATWAGQDLEQCQLDINTEGLTSFLREKQHETTLEGGLFSHVSWRRCEWADVPELERVVVVVDPAATSKDGSDSHAVQVDGRGVDRKLYRLFSWEQVATPRESLRMAIRKALEYGASEVEVEVNQGGETWRDVYQNAWRDLQSEGELPEGSRMPPYADFVVTSAHGPKASRWQKMLSGGYERGQIVHVIGTHTVLERALKRLPMFKPFDLGDAAWRGWHKLLVERDERPTATSTRAALQAGARVSRRR